MAKARAVRPSWCLANKLAPCSVRYWTTLRWPFQLALMRAVDPRLFAASTSAPLRTGTAKHLGDLDNLPLLELWKIGFRLLLTPWRPSYHSRGLHQLTRKVSPWVAFWLLAKAKEERERKQEMTRGNQREEARAKNQKKKDGKGTATSGDYLLRKVSSKFLTFLRLTLIFSSWIRKRISSQESDSKALAEKVAKKKEKEEAMARGELIADTGKKKESGTIKKKVGGK